MEKKSESNTRPYWSSYPSWNYSHSVSLWGPIEFVYNIQTGAQPLTLYNVLHTPGTSAHLISQGQIHRKGYTLSIIPDGIEVGATGVIAKFMSNNLCLITPLLRTKIPSSASTALNPHKVNMWHSRLGHLGKQNIVKLAGMSKGIDRSQPPPSGAPCDTLQVETHIYALFQAKADWIWYMAM